MCIFVKNGLKEIVENHHFMTNNQIKKRLDQVAGLTENKNYKSLILQYRKEFKHVSKLLPKLELIIQHEEITNE